MDKRLQKDAMKTLKALEDVNMAYRIGGRPKGSSLDWLRDHKERVIAALSAPTPPPEAVPAPAGPTWAPKRIFLQPADADVEEDVQRPTEQFDAEGATWCEDRTNDFDAEYIRADLVSRPTPSEAVKADPGALDLRDAVIKELYENQFGDIEPGEMAESKSKDPKWYAYWSQRADRLIALVRGLPPESSPKAGDVEALAKQAVRELGFLDTEEQVDYLANFAREAIRLSSGLTHGQVRAFDMGGWPDGKIVEIDADGTYRSASSPAVYEVRRKSEAPVSGKEGDRT